MNVKVIDKLVLVYLIADAGIPNKLMLVKDENKD